MNIQSISQYNGPYNVYPVDPITPVPAIKKGSGIITEETLDIQIQKAPHVENSDKAQVSNPIDKKEPVDLANISLTFNTGDDFSYIGKDSLIDNLDVMQAVSDMQKDSILQQYQTFVGDSNILFESEDGKVIMK